MNSAELLARLSQCGVELVVDGDKLRYRAPKDALTPELRDALIEHKSDLLAHLRGQIKHESASETSQLLAWASELAEHGCELSDSVRYVEAPLRTVTTARVSWYAGHYLRTISFARLLQGTSNWGDWTPRWWRAREEEALKALAALRQVLEERGAGESDEEKVVTP